MVGSDGRGPIWDAFGRGGLSVRGQWGWERDDWNLRSSRRARGDANLRDFGERGLSIGLYHVVSSAGGVHEFGKGAFAECRVATGGAGDAGVGVGVHDDRIWSGDGGDKHLVRVELWGIGYGGKRLGVGGGLGDGRRRSRIGIWSDFDELRGGEHGRMGRNRRLKLQREYVEYRRQRLFDDHVRMDRGRGSGGDPRRFLERWVRRGGVRLQREQRSIARGQQRGLSLR